MAERRPRLSLDVTTEELQAVKADAQAEGVSISRSVLNSVQIKRSLHQLSEAGMSVVLKNKDGEQVDEMTVATFRTFLESDSALVDHFLRGKPPKPQ